MLKNDLIRRLKFEIKYLEEEKLTDKELEHYDYHLKGDLLETRSL